MIINVTTRDGKLELLDLNKIRKQTEPACRGLNVSYEELELDANIFIKEGIKTTDIQDIYIKTALDKVSPDDSNWTYVAARLSTYNLYGDIAMRYGKEKGVNIYDSISLTEYLSTHKQLLSDFVGMYTPEEIEELNNYIQPDRDFMYNYLGFELIQQRILVSDSNGKIVELPQHFHMTMAMFIAQNEKDKIKWVKEFYDTNSLLECINASTINSNGRKRNGGTASCMIQSIPDSIEGIFDVFKEVAQGSKQGSGWGIDATRIRAVGGEIDGKPNAAGGSIPFLKILNDISLAVDQKGNRPGAFAVYMESWDLEIFDFIDLKKKNGEERRRARDLFLAISHSDVFMERERRGENWTLFDPYDVPMLTETHGSEFKKYYEEYEEAFRTHPNNFNTNTKVIEAKEIMRAHAVSYFEEGQPFTFFKDTVNFRHKREELGIIRSANLCTEYFGPTNGDDIPVCNLGSINLARVNTVEDLERVTRLQHRQLDNIIDITEYPNEKSKRTQVTRRAIGIGCLGEAEMLVNGKVHYGSNEHFKLIDDVYGTISRASLEYSKELAIEKGGCYLKDERNAYRMCVAPNTSSGLFAGTSNSHEPVYDIVWIEDCNLGHIKVTAPNINDENREFYIGAYDVDQKLAIKLTSIRQKYVDMGISHVLHLRPEDVTLKSVVDLIRFAWTEKLNTTYYVRSKPPTNTNIKTNTIACFGCDN